MASSPLVRIISAAGKQFSLPNAVEGANHPFIVDEDGFVFASAPDGEGGRQALPLSEEQAELILQLKHLDGAFLVEADASDEEE